MTDKSFSLENSVRPDSEEERTALNEIAYGLLPNDEVTVYTYSKERTLSVVDIFTYEDNDYNVPRQWVSRSIGEDEKAIILEGYGAEYVLFASEETSKVSPRLMWPSNRGVYVCGIEVTSRVSEVQSENTASDIYWRISAHDGR